MSRSVLLARRAGAHRGLLVLVLFLVAAVTAAVGTTLVAVRSAETAITHEGLTGADGDVATLEVTTRLRADPAEARAQDEALQETVSRLFGGTTYGLDSEEVPDDDSDDPFLRWTLTPDLAATTPADLPVLAEGAEELGPVLLDDDTVSERGVTVTGELGPRAAATAAAARAASAVTLVPLLLLALVGLVAVAQVARLLAATREAEVRLLVARGASPAQVTLAATAEALAVCVVAAGVGGAAAAWLALGGSGATPAGVAGQVAAPAAAVAALAAGTLGVVAGLQARAAAAGRPAELSGRARRAAAFGTVALTVMAAGVTLWLLRRYGSPLVPTPDGGQTDPAAAAAPALALAAAAVLVVSALGPLARGWAAVAARGRGAGGVLVARQVSRRLTVVAVPIVLVVLACGSLVLAATYAGTSQRLRADAALLATGTDVRVVAAGEQGLAGDVTGDLAGLDGVAAAEPALVQAGSVDHSPTATVALPPAGAAAVLRVPDGAGGAADLLGPLDGRDPFAGAPVLPPGADALTLGVTGSVHLGEYATEPGDDVERRLTWDQLVAATRGDDRAARELAQLEDSSVELRLWLADDSGRLTRVDAGALGYDLDGDGDPGSTDAGTLGTRTSTQQLTVPLPQPVSGTAGQRLVGLDLLPAGTFEWRAVLDLAVDSVRASTGGADDDEPVALPEDGGRWAPATGLSMEESRLGTPPTGLGATLQLDWDQPRPYRVVTAGAVAEHVPAVVSRPLADRLDLEVGERAELPVGTSTASVEVAGVVDAVPGAGQPAAALLGLGDLQAWQLDHLVTVPVPGEVWVGAPDARQDDGALADLGDEAAEVAGAPEQAEVTTSAVPARAGDAAGPVRAAFEVAAAGAVVLAVVGVAAAAVTTLRTRRPEVAVLRAVGVAPRAQGGTRALELLVVGLVATVVGLAVGVAVSAAVVPGLAGATLTGATVVPAVVPAVAWGALVLPGGLLLAGLLVVAGTIRGRVIAQARDTAYREEVR